jgi:hypothetical protein
MHSRRQLAALIVFGALTACTGRSEARQGYVVLGFETSAFQPCGDAEQGWLSGDTDVMRELEDAFAGMGETAGARLLVEVRGVLSREGSYGHLGAYPREFHVTEVLEARPSQAGDCGAGAL